MLSLGKLATGQSRYYLDQAHGSLTRAQSVRTGVEDYYLGGPEADGVWIGDGAAALGLRGEVAAVPLDRVLAGEHPATGTPLGRVLPARRPGFDLTFSAPKSVSVLFGVGDDALRAVIQEAHGAAVLDALRYMERAAAVTRRGAGGVHEIRGNGLVAAAFRHRTSRAGDPQLHTHVLVANLTLGADGQWSTLDGRRLYAHAKTAGYLYEARLRSLLTRELGVEWGAIRNGIADVEGVSPRVLRAFSRRRADIKAELARRGASGAAAAQVATLATRRGKDYRVAPEQLVSEWRERAAGLGLTAETVASLGSRRGARELLPELEDAVAERLAGPDGLTRDRSTFTRRDVLQAWCEQLPPGVDATVADLERLADALLASRRAVVVADGERREVLQRADGRAVPAARVERTYSTPELLAREREILEHAAERRDLPLWRATQRATERAIARRPSISGEQAEMVRRLTQEGDGVAVVVGAAGTGKTYALGAAREAWEVSGRSVRGTALARRAARELEDGAAIPSTSVAALLRELANHPYSALRPRSILVVDEAAMVPTRELAEVVDHARRLDVKLVLVGDDRQLPAIGAGGALRALQARLPTIELHENRRQVEAWERDALAALRAGDVPGAVARYDEAERIVHGESADALRARLVADWWASGDPDGAVMIAQRRADVADLNGRAHALLRTAGALGSEEVEVGGDAFAAGDRVLVRSNDRRVGVVNGDRGLVASVDRVDGSMVLDIGGRCVTLPSAFLQRPTRHDAAAIQHGYALTTHLAQGMTCRETFVLVTDQLTREAGYVALSRGRMGNRLYVLSGEPTDRDEYAPAGERGADGRVALEKGLGRSRVQTLALDTAGEAAAEWMAAREELAAAEATRRRLSRSRPPWHRPRARREHAAALDVAGQNELLAEERVAAAAGRLEALRRLRAVARVHTPYRTTERDFGLGR